MAESNSFSSKEKEMSMDSVSSVASVKKKEISSSCEAERCDAMSANPVSTASCWRECSATFSWSSMESIGESVGVNRTKSGSRGGGRPSVPCRNSASWLVPRRKSGMSVSIIVSAAVPGATSTRGGVRRESGFKES